ncbi:MAG TPA: nickel pincer cofactor biosynthesis protein LarC [Propionicimonas sp.]|nr:nickel pincer cofactor biosynthesis protein LarC [Propionicimonas sp.]
MVDPTGSRPAPLLAWIDARNGVAGDMLLGALADAGVSLSVMQHAIDAVMPQTVRLSSTAVQRAGLRACKVDVEVLIDDLPHRDWTVIRALLQGSPLPPAVKELALTVFEALAHAEARAHGIDVETVHFHEVGAWDSIADIVGVCAGLVELGVDSVGAGPVGVGSGSIRTAHGEIPIPVPAVLELSRGWQVVAAGSGELATPTGMALITTLAEPVAALPACSVVAVGVGAGSRDDPGRPNVVRLIIGAVAEVSGGVDEAWVLESNIDDLDPRLWPGVLSALMDAGADDAWLTPILMKKGRPAHTLHVLVGREALPRLRDRVFDLVPTLGLRETPVTKHVLDRLWVEVQVDGQPVRIKLGHRDGTIVTATPEFGDVAALAAATGASERQVLASANAAAAAAGLAVGADVPAP